MGGECSFSYCRCVNVPQSKHEKRRAQKRYKRKFGGGGGGQKKTAAQKRKRKKITDSVLPAAFLQPDVKAVCKVCKLPKHAGGGNG